MKPGSIAIFVSNDEVPVNGDALYPFKQNSDLFWLSGIVQEDSMMVLFPGNPDPKYISTSYTERANLTMRMSMRRFTRLTNAFSKKLTNHAHMVALYALWYNFVRIHKTLRVTPAMAARIADRLWSMEEGVALIDARSGRVSR